MKYFNKDNSMKKFKCVLGMATLVLAGNAFAVLPSLPKVPNGVPVINIASKLSWDSLSMNIDGKPGNDVVLKVTRNVKISNTAAMPASGTTAEVAVVNAKGKNIYIVGDNHTISGFVLNTDALFENVNNLYIENLNFKNCYMLAESASEGDRGRVAFIVDSTKADFYLNNVSFTNVGLKGGAHADGGAQPFSTAAFFVASAKNAVISDVSVSDLAIDSVSADTAAGLIGGVNNFRVENSHFKNISVLNMGPDGGPRNGASFWTGGIVGVISESSEFKMQKSSIQLNSLEFITRNYQTAAYVGGIVAKSGNTRMEWSANSVSGKINVINNVTGSGETSQPADFLVGGAIGFWGSSKTESKTLNMDDCVSDVDIFVESKQKTVSTSFDEVDAPRTTAVGGFVGSISLQKNIVVANRTFFFGAIDYKASTNARVAIGGFAGTYNGGTISLNDVAVKDSSITYVGAYANIGGLLGYVSDADGVNVDRFVMEETIQASLPSVMGAAIGGAVGVLSSVPLKIEKSTIKGDVFVYDNKSYKPDLTETMDLSVGGVVGYAGTPSTKGMVNGVFEYRPMVSVDLKSVDYKGRLSINRAYKGGDKHQYVGGFIGKSQDSDVSIEKSSVVGTNDTLMVTEFTGTDEYSPIKEGGFIGGSASNHVLYPPTVTIKESFVVGAIVSTGMKNSGTSYVSGFVGHYDDADNVNISDSYYRGALVAKETSPTTVVASGAIGLSNVPNTAKVSVKNSYVYDSQAAADSLVHVKGIEPSLSSAYLFSSLDALEGSTVEPSSPAFAYLLNEGESTPHWGYDANENEGLPQLGYIKGAIFKATKKVTLIDFEEDGSSPADIEIYTDSDGKWELTATGKRFSDNLEASTYDSKKKKIVFWKQKDGDLVWKGIEKTADDLVSGMVFEKTYADVPKVKFDFEFSDLSASEGVLFWDESDYSVVDNDSLPWVIFALSDNNGKKSIYKGRFWKVAGTSQPVSSSVDVINYVAQELLSKVTLEFDLDSLRTLVKMNPDALKDYKFQTNLGVINVSGSLKVHYTTMGQGDTVSFMPQFVLLPKTEKLSVVDLLSGPDTSTIAFAVTDSKGNVLYEEVLFNEEFDLSSALSNDDMLTIMAKARTKKSDDEPSGDNNDPSVDPTNASDPTNPDNPDTLDIPTPPSNICADRVQIVESRVAKSGTAALFAFKLDAPDPCKSEINPKVTVSGPNGKLMDSYVAFSNTNEFVFYPLEPGAYTFMVKVTSEKTKTIKQHFSADIEIRGRAWNMVAYGSWPKNVLKKANPTIYTWNESNAIGDYWQYESFPKGEKADEMTGYWVRSESSLNFSLDLPLKTAESDSLSWTVEKKFSGWNLLANPYSWNLYVGSVAEFKSSESNKAPVWRWNSDKARYEVADTLFANEAFWVRTDKKRTLRVSTKPVFPAPKAAPKKQNSLFRSATKNSWSMVLVASSDNGVSDSWNVFGVGSKDIAIAEPPAGMESGVTVSFVDGKDLLAKRILARASSGDEYSWKVNVKSAKGEKVNLSLEGLDDVRAMGYRAVLVMDDKTYEWGESSTISVDASGSKTAELKVVPANAKVAVSKGIADMKYSVSAGQFAVNFNVPAEMAGKVAEVRLLDMNGNVISMARGKAQAGTNDMRLGSVARNGVYVLMVRVGSVTRSARIAL